MVVRELVALFGVKADKKSFSKAGQMMEGLKTTAVRLGGLIAGAFAINELKNIVLGFGQYSEELDKMSERTGVSTDTLQKLGYVANLAGMEMGVFELAIRKTQVAMGKSDKGGEKSSGVLQEMGIAAKDANGNMRDVSDMLPEMADKFVGMKSSAERTAMAVKLFGRSGTRLLPILMQGGDALRAMMQEAEDMGLVLGKDDVKAGAKFQKNWRRTQSLMKALKLLIGKSLIPAFNHLIERFLKWYAANRKLISQRIENFFRQVGKAIEFLAPMVENIAGFVADIFDAFEKLSPSTLKWLAIIGGSILVAVNPFAGLITALALIIDDFEVWKRGGKSLIGTLTKLTYPEFVSFWTNAFDTVKQSFDTFINAVSEGTVWERIWKTAKWYGNLLKEFWCFIPNLILGQWRASLGEIGNSIEEHILKWVKMLNDWCDNLPAPVKKVLNLLSGGGFESSGKSTQTFFEHREQAATSARDLAAVANASFAAVPIGLGKGQSLTRFEAHRRMDASTFSPGSMVSSPTININATTNASPEDIARAVKPVLDSHARSIRDAHAGRKRAS